MVYPRTQARQGRATPTLGFIGIPPGFSFPRYRCPESQAVKPSSGFAGSISLPARASSKPGARPSSAPVSSSRECVGPSAGSQRHHRPQMLPSQVLCRTPSIDGFPPGTSFRRAGQTRWTSCRGTVPGRRAQPIQCRILFRPTGRPQRKHSIPA